MHPSPPPESASYRNDPRITLTRKELSWIDVLMPDFEKCHSIEAGLPQECIAMTDHSFLSYLFESMYFVTSYRQWHDLQDKRPAYQYHRQFLQQLQWRCPGTHCGNMLLSLGFSLGATLGAGFSVLRRLREASWLLLGLLFVAVQGRGG